MTNLDLVKQLASDGTLVWEEHHTQWHDMVNVWPKGSDSTNSSECLTVMVWNGEAHLANELFAVWSPGQCVYERELLTNWEHVFALLRDMLCRANECFVAEGI